MKKVLGLLCALGSRSSATAQQELGSGMNVLYVERHTVGFWFLKGAEWMATVFGLEALSL